MEESVPASLPRPLRIGAIAVAALALFALFVYQGFPYDSLGATLAARIERATGAHVVMGAVDPSPQLLGPGIALANVRVRLPDGRVLAFERVRLRLAWSTSWLRARPAIAVDAESASGRIRGVVTLGQPPAFEGDAEGLDLRALGLESLTRDLSVDGAADVSVDLGFGEAGAEGPVSLIARSGSLAHPALPMAIPYEEIRGELFLGGETALRIESLTIRSSLGEGSVGGTVGHAAQAAAAPLDLQLTLTAAPAMQAALRAQGVRLDPDGSTQLRIGGTAGRPVVR